MARLNDTRALVESPGDGDSHSISTEKIGDKYLVRSSRYNGATGQYHCSEQILDSPPRIIPGRVARGEARGDAAGSKGLADVKQYMKP